MSTPHGSQDIPTPPAEPQPNQLRGDDPMRQQYTYPAPPNPPYVPPARPSAPADYTAPPPLLQSPPPGPVPPYSHQGGAAGFQPHPGTQPGHPGGTSWNSSDQAWWPGGEAFKIKPSIPVPMEVQRSFVLWMAAAGLMLLNFVLNMMQSVSGGGGSVGSAFFNLLLAAAIAYGAAQMRLGKAWGRLLNSIIGGLLGLLLLISLLGILTLLAILSSLLGAGAVLLALITLLTVGTALGLIVSAIVYMFRAPASNYLSRQTYQ